MFLILASLSVVLSACSGFDNNLLPARPTNNTISDPGNIDEQIEPIDKSEFIQGNVFISESELFIMESFPVQISLNLLGELPTPCHSLEVAINPPGDSNVIAIDVFSLSDPAMTCIQVLEPFEENISIPVKDLSDGIYEVFLNGEKVGEFSYPA